MLAVLLTLSPFLFWIGAILFGVGVLAALIKAEVRSVSMVIAFLGFCLFSVGAAAPIVVVSNGQSELPCDSLACDIAEKLENSPVE